MISDRNKGEKNMKAAILSKYGKLPVYQDFPDPVVHKADETLIYPTASAIKQLDISKAAGTHYTKFDKLPSVVGTDGVGITDAGDRIYTMGITGMMAEKAIIKKKGGIIIPKGLDDGVAAAIPNTLVGSDLALMVKGGISLEIVFSSMERLGERELWQYKWRKFVEQKLLLLLEETLKN